MLRTFHQKFLKSFPDLKKTFIQFLLEIVYLLHFLCRLQFRTWEKLEALLDLESPQEYEIISLSENKSSSGELDSTRPDEKYAVFSSSEYAVLSAEGQYAILITQNTPYCLEEQIRRLDCRSQYAVLSEKVDTSYPTSGYGVSVDLSEQDT
ncbi:hypothetical protein Tco_0009249 [Tanacetum coccineum]